MTSRAEFKSDLNEITEPNTWSARLKKFFGLSFTLDISYINNDDNLRKDFNYLFHVLLQPEVVPTKLHLNLSNNHFNDEDLQLLAKVIEKHKVEGLILQNCCLNDAQAKKIANHVALNDVLYQLNLLDNPRLTDKGANAILDARALTFQSLDFSSWRGINKNITGFHTYFSSSAHISQATHDRNKKQSAISATIENATEWGYFFGTISGIMLLPFLSVVSAPAIITAILAVTMIILPALSTAYLFGFIAKEITKNDALPLEEANGNNPTAYPLLHPTFSPVAAAANPYYNYARNSAVQANPQYVVPQDGNVYYGPLFRAPACSTRSQLPQPLPSNLPLYPVSEEQRLQHSSYPGQTLYIIPQPDHQSNVTSSQPSSGNPSP